MQGKAANPLRKRIACAALILLLPTAVVTQAFSDDNGVTSLGDLAGVDAPEANQPWGQTAADRLGRQLTGAFVVVGRLRDDGSGGLSGEIVFEGRDVARDLLYDGLAWSTIPVDYQPGARLKPQCQPLSGRWNG